MQIKIRYFAGLKEIAKKGEEILSIKDKEMIDTEFIKRKICNMYGIDDKRIFNIAINGSLGEKEIREGDIVSIHPIYRGG